MAEETQVAAEPARKSGVLGAVVWSSFGLILGVTGFAIPLLFPSLFGGADEVPKNVPDAKSQLPAFVPFGETVVNLNSDRLNRYLRIHITLQVELGDESLVTAEVERHKAILKSWLISYLSDVSMSDIRGAAGQNRLRREIQDHFNSVLSDDGFDRVNDVLFEEFNVQ